MPKYIVRNFNPGKKNHNKINPLIQLSALGINTNQSIIKTSLSVGLTEDPEAADADYYTSYYGMAQTNKFNRYRDITKTQSTSYAFFDLGYEYRRDQLRQFACDNDIIFILDTIANEAIVPDENGYFAHVDLDRLKMRLNQNYKDKDGASNAQALLRDCQSAFNTIYSCYGWDRSNDAWNYFKKFLIEGYLAFEILYDDNMNPTTIQAFKELDVATLEPEIHIIEGKEVLVWYQYRGDAKREHIIPDSNIVYISWTSMNFAKNARISYLEGVIRSFNMLRQLENAHLIWNIQNSQKRMKITVPVGTMTDAKAQQRVAELIADYAEEVTMDDASGEMIVNGEPKFSFSKTYVFPAREGNSTSIEEISGEGYDMNSTQSMEYFWRKFIMESQVPANRFPLSISAPQSNALLMDANISREEYAFSRFINRIQAVFKDLLLKPLWIQICLKHPELSYIDYFRQCLGIKFNEENLFNLAKKRQVVDTGASTVQTLFGMKDDNEKSIFSINWLIKEYLGLSDADIELNNKYKRQDVIKQIKNEKIIASYRERLNKEGIQEEGLEDMSEQNFNPEQIDAPEREEQEESTGFDLT